MRRFWSDEKGSMIALFCLALIPVLGLMGAAIDYSRANLARTKMQGALDAAAVFLSRLPDDTSQDELNAKVAEFFYVNYADTDVLSIQLTVTPDAVPGKLNLTAKGIYDPKLVNIVGISNFPVGASTKVSWQSRSCARTGQDRLHVLERQVHAAQNHSRTGRRPAEFCAERR